MNITVRDRKDHLNYLYWEGAGWYYTTTRYSRQERTDTWLVGHHKRHKPMNYPQAVWMDNEKE